MSGSSGSSALPVKAATADLQISTTQDEPLQGLGPHLVTGQWLVKEMAGKVGRMVVDYIGVTASVFVQIHRSSEDTGLSSDSMLEPGIEVGVGAKYAVFAPIRKLVCANGICVAFSSTRSTYTSAGAEAGYVTIYGE